MKVKKIAPKIPDNVPVATLEVTQNELNLLTMLVGQCNGNSTGAKIYNLYQDLQAAGGDRYAFNVSQSKQNSSNTGIPLILVEKKEKDLLLSDW